MIRLSFKNDLLLNKNKSFIILWKPLASFNLDLMDGKVQN